MGELAGLPNVGKVLERNLKEVGIHTVKQLGEIGSKEAFTRIRTIDPGACLHMLYGLQGAIEGIKDSLLSDNTKNDLKSFYNNLAFMNWDEKFNEDNVPSKEDIGAYIKETRPIWDELTAYIEETYQVKAQSAFSKCPMQPGWNIKYKKGGKALCTLYPMASYFIALVVVGPKEEDEVKTGIEAGLFTDYLKELFYKTSYSAMGRWLMIEVRDKTVLNDIKELLGIRVKPKKSNG